MTSTHVHFLALAFAGHNSAGQDDVIACVSADEAISRADQMNGYAEYDSTVALRVRSRNGKMYGQPHLLAQFGDHPAEFARLLKRHLFQ